jgi:hypothetical protein
VVGGVSARGGETRGREGVMPGLINENPVQTDEGGGGSTIRPSVSTVPEGKLKKRRCTLLNNNNNIRFCKVRHAFYTRIVHLVN